MFAFTSISAFLFVPLLISKIARVFEHGENQQWEVAGLDGVDPNTYISNIGPVWKEGRVAEVAGIISVITELKRAKADPAFARQVTTSAARVLALKASLGIGSCRR